MKGWTAADAIKHSVITADTAEPYVAQLARQLEAFSSITDVDELSGNELGELLLVMANAVEQLETQTSHVALMAQRKGVGKHLGSASTGAWVAHRTKTTPAHVHRMIRRSETEHAFGLFYLAHADGKITGFHLDHLGHLWRNNPHVEDLLYRDEQILCNAASTLSPTKFALVCRKWLSLADPDGAYEKYLLDMERRFLSGHKDLDGNLRIVGQLDPITGEAFDTLVTRRANELFEQDWAKAKAKAADGEIITKDILRRSDGQRRIDALMSLVIDGSSTPEGSQRPEPMLYFGLDSVTFEEYLDHMLAKDLASEDTVDSGDFESDETDAAECIDSDEAASNAEPEDTGASGPAHSRSNDDLRLPQGPSTAAAVDPNRRCETGQGQPVPFRVMLQQVMTLQIRRVVFGAPSVVIDAGEIRRLFSPVQRELIKHRDRCCTFPGCHRDAIYCETDHILAVTDGGPTDLINGQCLCRFHHRLKTRGRFTCERSDDGHVRFYLPNGHQIE